MPTSKPGRPDSATVGMSGAASLRSAVLIASARSRPSLMKDRALSGLVNIIGTCPATTSAVAGP